MAWRIFRGRVRLRYCRRLLVPVVLLVFIVVTSNYLGSRVVLKCSTMDTRYSLVDRPTFHDDEITNRKKTIAKFDPKNIVSDGVQSPTDTPTVAFKATKLLIEYHRKGLVLREKFNCSLLFNDNVEEMKRVTDYLRDRPAKNRFSEIPDSETPGLFRGNCEAFKRIRGYRKTAITEEERDFPLAYVVIVHKGFEQLERLVRSLYHPQHVFCIHLDLKAPERLYKAVSSFASCFHNIHLVSQRYNVTYAHVTRLLADLTCMKDLSRLRHRWRYLVTMVSTEFPLRSNGQKVAIFHRMNGANDVRMTWNFRSDSRYRQRYIVVNGNMKKTRVLKSPPPHNITVIKGRAANSFSRAFVDWLAHNKMADDLLQWSMDTLSPDEHYWATLNDLYHNPFLNTPGGYTGPPDTKRYVTNFAVWVPKNSTAHPNYCQGLVRHHVCVFGSRNLARIKRKHQLCVNKMDIAYDPVAYACMEELIEGRESNPEPLDWSLYQLSRSENEIE